MSFNGCRNTLEVGMATLNGCAVKAVNWMEKFGDWKHMQCVGDWQGSARSMTWDFKTVEPASYYLDVEYTCPEADDYSEWGIRCGENNTLTFPLIDTGERAKRKAFGGALPRFRTYRVGVIDFPKPGVQKLTFGPTTAEGKNIRVSALRLTPET